ncbi:Prenyltransferase and squalene oxidase repeat protein [Anatilimnocola aggregata]|uniref:Prenyltransferase and squalene oxidase repeat protein n=1 Tax=Anatilimnocola aggregata TaxID=2528021 RepID=A0A517YDI5_9BACT|nr:prenyltransferase/squalene oxidase repeat-containing protein [Anatilimnocola aggregata]QDU28192.1 Prenyltransferase and squalene oxidase repeat protein [Anatilimnocola aggregata]
MMLRRFHHLRWLSGLLVFATLACGPWRSARAVTPDSPDVKAVLDKAFQFLETADDARLGGKCLIGLAFLKNGADEKHPKIEAAVKACIAATKRDATEIKNDIYSTGIAIIFLCTLNPSKYSVEILKLRDSLLARQKPHGGWGYPERDTGDTSMTQYAVLSFWEISKAGLGCDIESTEKVANWIIRTQDPGGSFGYQGREATFEEEEGKKPKMELVKQDSAKLSMAAAGLGCTYMVADLLKLSELTTERDAKLPPALRPVKKPLAQVALTDKVELRYIRAAQERGRSWLAKNYKIDPPGFTFYYLYGLERYQSFYEASEGRFIKEPRWYNEGFVYLKKEQQEDGSWKGANEALNAPDTAFAVLFLLRSTKKAIEKSRAYSEATLVSGRGLPGNSQEVAIRSGRIVQTKVNVTITQLVDILHAPEHKAFGTVSGDLELLRERLTPLTAAEQATHLARLRTLALTGGAESRLAAVKVLGLVRDLHGAESLIAALDDLDWRIVVAADHSLRQIGRIVSPSTLGDKPNKVARADAIQSWKLWLLSIRPDAEFFN